MPFEISVILGLSYITEIVFLINELLVPSVPPPPAWHVCVLGSTVAGFPLAAAEDNGNPLSDGFVFS